MQENEEGIQRRIRNQKFDNEAAMLRSGGDEAGAAGVEYRKRVYEIQEEMAKLGQQGFGTVAVDKLEKLLLEAAVLERAAKTGTKVLKKTEELPSTESRATAIGSYQIGMSSRGTPSTRPASEAQAKQQTVVMNRIERNTRGLMKLEAFA
jgi:hypothetical protein